MEQEEEAGFNLEEQQGTAAEWIAKDPVQRKIAARFRNFLLNFEAEDDGQQIYKDSIRDMCAGNAPPSARMTLCVCTLLVHAYEQVYLEHILSRMCLS